MTKIPYPENSVAKSAKKFDGPADTFDTQQNIYINIKSPNEQVTQFVSGKPLVQFTRKFIRYDPKMCYVRRKHGSETWTLVNITAKVRKVGIKNEENANLVLIPIPPGVDETPEIASEAINDDFHTSKPIKVDGKTEAYVVFTKEITDEKGKPVLFLRTSLRAHSIVSRQDDQSNWHHRGKICIGRT